MTDRVRSLTVALMSDVRDDDIEALRHAIQMLRGVLDVSNNISNPNDWTTEQRVRRELQDKLYKALQ